MSAAAAADGEEVVRRKREIPLRPSLSLSLSRVHTMLARGDVRCGVAEGAGENLSPSGGCSVRGEFANYPRLIRIIDVSVENSSDLSRIATGVIFVVRKMPRRNVGRGGNWNLTSLRRCVVRYELFAILHPSYGNLNIEFSNLAVYRIFKDSEMRD